MRRNGREEALDDDVELPGSEGDDPERQAEDAQVARRIQVAMLGMSLNDRMVLTLRHFSECSYQEIGQILDLDEKTVKSRLFEARHRLRDLLQDLRGN
jgi:RNA polymerase sigma-70 factor (ECF subfamily)